MTIHRFIKKTISTLAVAMALVPVCGFSAQTYWTDWQSATTGNNGSASGVITLQDASTINVSYTGGLYFAQTPNGADYWSPNVYTSAVVSNAPDSLNNGILAIGTGSALDTITFSRAVVNPIMSIVSLNGPTFTFDAPFTVLSSGCGYWGCGNLSYGAGNVLSSNGEGHGTIQFNGTFTSISFSESGAENWRGITVGVSPTPEPETYAMMIAGLGLVGSIARRRKTALALS